MRIHHLVLLSALMMLGAACPGEEPAPTTDADAGPGDAVAEVDVSPPEDKRVTVFLNGIGNGLMTSDPAGIDCGSTCSADFAVGTEVTLRPLPGVGHRFGGFSGDTCSGFDVCRFTISDNLEVGITWEPMSLTGVGGADLGDAGTDDSITALAASSFGTVYGTFSSSTVGLARLADAGAGAPETLWQKNFGTAADDCPDLILTSLPDATALVAGRGGAGFDLDPGGAAPVDGEGTFVAQYSDGETALWSHVANAGCPTAIAAAGDVVAWTGEVTGAGASIDGDLGTNDTAVSMVLAAYDLNTQAPKWSRAIGTAEFDVARGRAIAVDSSGGIAAAARVVHTGAVDFGGGPLPDGSAVTVARYDASGNHVWSLNYGGINHDVATLDVLDNGDLLMTGVETQGAQQVAFVTRMNGQGEPLWLENLDYADQQAPTDVLSLADGNLLVAGWRYTPSAPFAEATLTQLSGAGVMMWRQEIGSATGEERAFGIAEGAGGVWLSGWFEGDQPWDVGGPAPLNASGGTDGFVIVVTEALP